MLEKRSLLSKMDILYLSFRTIQVLMVDQVLEDGVVISNQNRRYCISPGSPAPEDAPQEVLDAVIREHTPEVIAEYIAYQASLGQPQGV